MKSLSMYQAIGVLSRAIDSMATSKKATVSHRAVVWMALGTLIGGMIDMRSTLSSLQKLPTALPVIEAQGIELRELRRLREQDHHAIEEIMEILRRNKIGDKGPEKTDISTAQYEE